MAHVAANIFTLLRVPGVLLAALSIMSTSMSIGFLQATLEPHLRHVTHLKSPIFVKFEGADKP